MRIRSMGMVMMAGRCWLGALAQAIVVASGRPRGHPTNHTHFHSKKVTSAAIVDTPTLSSLSLTSPLNLTSYHPLLLPLTSYLIILIHPREC